MQSVRRLYSMACADELVVRLGMSMGGAMACKTGVSCVCQDGRERQFR